MIENIAFSFFGLPIYWYGITYVVGFVFSYFFLKFYLKDFLSLEKFENVFLFVMIFSCLGARIFEVLFYNLSFYLEHPVEIFFVNHGGLSIHGGLFFGFLTLFFFSRKYNFDFLKVADIFCIPLSLFLAFGRLANFVNQELVGIKTNSCFGVVFFKYDNFKRFPTQIFESFKNFFVFEFLYFLYVFKKLRSGFLTSIFLILYNFLRFFIDFLREPTFSLGLISMGQFLCLIFGFFGVFLLVKIYKK